MFSVCIIHGIFLSLFARVDPGLVKWWDKSPFRNVS